jgi:Domain of unknown function (DUF4258)
LACAINLALSYHDDNRCKAVFVVEQPWPPAEATRQINRISGEPRLTLCLTEHAKQRMIERDLITGDVLFVLKRGFVHTSPEASSQPGLFKYQIEARTPNSGGRVVRIVAIPDPVRVWVKVVTVMWVDE